MVVKCEVKFDNNPNGVYFAGQTLAGVVELTIDEPKTIRGLILKVEGCAKVEWAETRHNNTTNNLHNNSINNSINVHNTTTSSRTIFYSGREDYISSVFYLIGSAEGNEISLSPGHYRYNFQALLPAQLPTSCEAPYGAIRYLVSVVLDRPYKFDLTYKLAFTVIKQLDLNYENPSLQLPLKMESINTFCCSILKTKPLYLSVSIPMGGYVSGQAIKVSIEISNESRVDVEDVRVSLKKIVRYNAQIPHPHIKEERTSEAEIRCGGVQKRTKIAYDQQLFIPAVPPTNINYCRILNVSYEVQVKCKISGVSTSPVVKLPIIIGTVPIQSNHNFNFDNPSSVIITPMIENMTYDQMLESFSPQINGQNSNLPPSYADAIYTQEAGIPIELSEIGEHTMGTLRPFHPMYPVYYGHEQNSINSSNVIQLQQPRGSVPNDTANIEKY